MLADLPQSPGLYELSLKAGQDRFALSIPDGYERTSSSSFIFMLHWGGPAQPYRGEAILSGLALPALGSLGAIMAAPDCPDQSWTTERSENTILELMDSLQRFYSIDPDRCLITGYSMGAIGTWHMAASYQERFAAALPIAATPPQVTTRTTWRIPIYVIHSTHDEVFPLKATQQVVEQLHSQKVAIELRVVQGITHFNVGGFIKPLKDTVPWIQRVWSSQDSLDIHSAQNNK
jgi:poly(3-hydroxybutyrate) depolymerase